MFSRTIGRMKEDINSVFDRDPAARTTFEVLLNYPGLHAIWMHRLSHRLWLANWKLIARTISTFSRWLTGVEIHPGATLGRRFFIDHGMGVVIGETAEIGDDCTLYHGVTLGGTSWQAGKRHPTLGNNVVVGAGAKILGPIKVNDGARIGSNAVVVREVNANTTVTGVPGREVVQRTDAQKKREDIARKMGFDAYGATQDMSDPVADTVNRMLDHIHKMDERMDEMCAQIHHLDAEFDLEPLPKIKAQGFGRVEADKKDDIDCSNT